MWDLFYLNEILQDPSTYLLWTKKSDLFNNANIISLFLIEARSRCGNHSVVQKLWILNLLQSGRQDFNDMIEWFFNDISEIIKPEHLYINEFMWSIRCIHIKHIRPTPCLAVPCLLLYKYIERALPCSAILHDEPKLVIFSRRTFLNESTIISCYVSVSWILF